MVLSRLASTPSSTDGAITSNIPNVYYWWHAGDVATNVVISNQFLDRIQGKLMGQMDPTKQITNHIKGIHFDNNGFLTNLPSIRLDQNLASIGLSYMVMIIFEFESLATVQMIMTDSTASGRGLYQYNTDNHIYFVNNTFNSLGFLPTIGNSFDLLFVPTNGQSHVSSYTNAINTSVNNNESSQPFSLAGLGRENGGTQLARGFLRDIVVWTNNTSFSYSSANISNAHWWATNTYKTVSPISP